MRVLHIHSRACPPVRPPWQVPKAEAAALSALLEPYAALEAKQRAWSKAPAPAPYEDSDDGWNPDGDDDPEDYYGYEVGEDEDIYGDEVNFAF